MTDPAHTDNATVLEQSPRLSRGLFLEPAARTYLPRGVGPLVVAAAGVVMCAWSWGKWPDPVIDFGREVYVPWRLSEGEVLYRDIVSYFNGPLSPYAHALLFKLFGVSLRTLVIFNLILIALLAAMLYRLVLQVSDDVCATAASVVFFVLFAFAQLVPTGNYNYVCPYSYELPHGITLTVAGITFLSMWIRRDRAIWLALSGGMLGLVALTKAEVFLAAAIALGAGLIAALFALKRPRARSALIFVGAAIVPPILAFALLLLVLTPAEALPGMLGSWRWIGDRTLTNLPYFKQLAGTDDIPASLRTILLWSADYVLLLVPAVVVGFFVRRERIAVVLASLALAAAAIYLGRRFMFQINWNDFIRPAPLVLAVMCVLLLVRFIRTRDARLALPLTLIVWAGAMLAKMPLNAHVYHYGFALAMPATLMLVVTLLGWLPRAMESARVNGWPLRATVLAALIVAIWAYTYPLHFFFSQKTIAVGRGVDQFLADHRGRDVNSSLEFLRQEAQSGETLVMMPEGLIVNYLARMRNPSGQLNFTPPAVIMYGETELLTALKVTSADWIGLVSIDTREYGARQFGYDYARELALIRDDYEGRFQTRDWGSGCIELMKRRAAIPGKQWWEY